MRESSDDRPELLLFDDSRDTGKLVVWALQDDFKVTFCTTEDQLREEIRRDRFCVVACDVSIQNSNSSGYEIMGKLRDTYEIVSVPVVVYSAVRDLQEIKRVEGSNFAEYIDKAQQGWDKKLLAACIRWCARTGRLVFADVMERKLKDHLDDPLDVPKFSPDAEILGVSSIPNLTVKTALVQLRKKELDKETEAVYTAAIENYYEYIQAL